MSTESALRAGAARARRERRVAAGVVAVFIALAAVTRLVGLDALLPQLLLRDGLAVVLQVEWLRSGDWPQTYDQRWGAYPHLLARIGSLLPVSTAEQGASLLEHLRCAIEPWVQIRCVNVLASIALVPATYLLARRFLDRPRAALAAGFVATSLGIMTHALQERPHALLTLATLLSTLAALRLTRRTSVGAHLGAAAAGAAAIGALHSGVLALLPIAFARWKQREARPIGRWLGLSIVVAAAAVAVGAFYPFLLGPRPPEAPGGAVSMRGQTLHFGRFTGGGVDRLLDWMWWFEPVLTVLAIAGLVWLVVRVVRAPAEARRAVNGELGVVLAFALPYFSVFAIYDESAGRYVMPLVPFFALLAASIAPRTWWCLLLVLPSALSTVRLCIVRARPDTIEEAARLVELSVPPHERLATIPDFDVPLATDPRAVAENFHPKTRSIWNRYQAQLPSGALPEPRYDVIVSPLRFREPPAAVASDPLGVTRRSGARWVLIDCAESVPEQDRFRAQLRAEARLVGRISHRLPGDASDEPLLDVAKTWAFTVVPLPVRVWRARALGPTLELYALP